MVRQTREDYGSRTLATALIEGLEPRVFLSVVRHHPHVVASTKPVAAQRVAAVSAPASVSAVATSANSVQVNWAPVPTATGYNILKSEGKRFAVVASVTTPGFNDTSVMPNHAYSYQVQALGATKTALSKTVSATTPVAAPTALTGTFQDSAIQLKWTDTDPSATAYLVLRSTDGTHYSQLAKLVGKSIANYTDKAVTLGHVYKYEIQTLAGTKTSATSNAISVTAAPMGSPDSISIATRFGNELVITANGATDVVALSQSGDTLNITANGQTFTNTVPAAGVFGSIPGAELDLNHHRLFCYRPHDA